MVSSTLSRERFSLPIPRRVNGQQSNGRIALLLNMLRTELGSHLPLKTKARL